MAATADRIQDLTQRLSEDSATLVRAEIELAKAEVRDKLRLLAVSAGLGAAAAVIAVLGAFALVQTAIFGLAEALPLWASALIVTVVLFVAAAGFAFAAKAFAKRGAPPVPQMAIDEAKATADQLRDEVHQ
jgi:hypothetical protein